MAPPNNLLELQLYRFIVEHYSEVAQIDELARRLPAEVLSQPSTTAVEERTAELLEACKKRGYLGQLRDAVGRQQYFLFEQQRLKGKSSTTNTTDLLNLVAPGESRDTRRIALSVSPDKTHIFNPEILTQKVSFVRHGPPPAGMSTEELFSLVDKCSAFGIVLGQDSSHLTSNTRESLASGLNYSLFRGLTAYIFHPASMPPDMEAWSTGAERTNLILKPYENDVGLHIEVNSIFVSRPKELFSEYGSLGVGSQKIAQTTFDIFISYSSQDRALCEDLVKHLQYLVPQWIREIWYDQELTAGTNFKERISSKINEAHIILALVSPDFRHSRYIQEGELPIALARHERKEARLVPIILKPCGWAFGALGSLHVLPRGQKPVNKWLDRDEAFLDIVEGIAQVVTEFRESSRRSRAIV